MGISLSRKLNLKLNGYPINLQKPLDDQVLKRHEVKKAGFIARLMLKPEKGETIYWAKHCTLMYLDDDPANVIAPVIGKGTDPAQRLGTTAFFHYTGRILSGFAFQISNHAATAAAALETFEMRVRASIGDPSNTDSYLKTWKDAGQKLIVDPPAEKRHGYIHLMVA